MKPKMVIGTLLTLTIAGHSASANIDDYLALNKEYMQARDRQLHLEIDGELILERKVEELTVASEEHAQKQEAFTHIDNEFHPISQRRERIPRYIASAQQSVEQARSDLQALKTQAVEDGLFESSEQVARENVFAKISSTEEQKSRVTQQMTDLDGQIEILTKREDYQNAHQTLEAGKANIESHKATSNKEKSSLSDLRDTLALNEKKQSEVQSKIQALKAGLSDLEQNDLPPAEKKRQDHSVRYNADAADAAEKLRRKNELERRIRSLRSQRSDKERELSRANQSISTLEAELSDIRSQIRALPGLYSDLRSLDRQISNAEREERRLERLSGDWRRRVESATSSRDQARREKRQAANRRSEAKSQFDTISARVDELVARKANLERAVARKPQVQSKLNEVNGRISTTSGNISRLQGEVAGAESRFESAKGQRREAQQQLRQARQKLENANGRLQAARGELSSAQSELSSARSSGDEAAIAAAEKKVRQAEKKISRVEGKVREHESSVNQAEAQVASAQSAVSQAKSEVQGLKRDLGRAEKRLQRLQSERSELEGRLQNIAEKERRLNNVTNTRLPRARANKRQARTDLQNARSQFQAAEQLLQQREGELSSAEREWRSVRSSLSETRGHLRSLRASHDDTQREIRRLETLKARGEDIERTDLPNAIAWRDQTQRELTAVRRLLARARSDHQEASALYAAAVTRRDQSKLVYDRAEEHLQLLKRKKRNDLNQLKTHEKTAATIDQDVVTVKSSIERTQLVVTQAESEIIKINQALVSSAKLIREIQENEIQPLETRLGELSGSLTQFERISRTYRDLWDGFKGLLKAESRSLRELESIKEEAVRIEEVFSRLKPQHETALRERDISRQTHERVESELEQLREDIQTLPGRLEVLEIQILQAMNDLLQGVEQ